MRIWMIAGWGLIGLLVFALDNLGVSADSAGQLARGAQMFKIRCEPCHGDVGQGLAMWRLTWAPEDQFCASHKCHGLGHPPDGFYMPNDAPAIIGTSTLMRFATARELETYIRKQMPFDKPGELSADDYWAVTAFLLNANDKLPAGVSLDASTAVSVVINPYAMITPTPIATETPAFSSNALAIGLGVVVLAAISLISMFIRRRA